MLVFRGFFSLSYNPVLQGSEGVYLREMSGICRHSAPPRTFQVIPLLTYFTILSALRGIGLKFLRELVGEHRGAPGTDRDGERNEMGMK